MIAPAPVDRLVEQFDAGEFDVAAVGRALLADPGWVNRLRDGELAGFGGYHAETALSALRRARPVILAIPDLAPIPDQRERPTPVD